MSTDTFTQILTLMTCSCGISFAVPETWRLEQTRTHKTFYCPNGCQIHYPGKSDLQQLRDDRDYWRTRFSSEATQKEYAERCRAAQQGVNTKLKKRIASGVCPCCQRTFKNLAQHMEGQHPNWLSDQSA